MMSDEVLSDQARTPARRRRSSKEVVDTIVKAAQEVFAECGYDGTTMREVARRSGIHEPTLYRHFPSKDALFDVAVFGRFDRQLVEAFEHPTSASPARDGEALTPVFDAMLSFMSSDRRLVISVMDRLCRPEAKQSGVTKRVADQVSRLIDRVSPMLEGQGSNRAAGTRDETHALAALMLTAAIGIALLEPVLAETRHALAAESLVRQMAKRRVAAMGLDVNGLSEEGSAKVLELIQRVLDANRQAAQAQLELEHLARWGSSCPQNGPGVVFGPQDWEDHPLDPQGA